MSSRARGLRRSSPAPRSRTTSRRPTMCRRDTQDDLVRMFLDRYTINLLSPPGDRVRCGSVYVKAGRSFTAPGELSELVEPPVTLPDPYLEKRIEDLSGSWSDKTSA